VSKHQDFKSNLRRGGRAPRILMVAKGIVHDPLLLNLNLLTSNALRHRVQTGSRADPDSCPMSTGGALSLGIKRPVREADHSPHLVPRSRMRGAIPPLHQYVFMAWCLVKHRDNFIFS
jgi:hypothetical protein